MKRKNDRPNGADLEQVNAELRKSLEHCRELLAECRTKLAANSDDPSEGEAETDGERTRA